VRRGDGYATSLLFRRIIDRIERPERILRVYASTTLVIAAVNVVLPWSM